MKYLFILVLLLSYFTSGQVVFERTSHDFGDLYEFSDRFVDVKLTNKNPKRAFVLSINKPSEINYIFTGQEMQPDSSVILRFQVNPIDKGRFNYKIQVFTSDRDEAVTLTLKGVMEEKPEQFANNLQNCPSFGQRQPGVDPRSFEMTIAIIDSETKRPISKANVNLIQNGREVLQLKTNKDGKAIEKTPLGFTYFYVNHPEYVAGEVDAYINFQRNYLVIELLRKTEKVVAELPKIDSTLLNQELDLDSLLTESISGENVPHSLSELDANDFTSENFKPVNVVFVLDVSASMKNNAKMDLLKYSLYELVDMLRPQDQIGLVTYSSKAKLILESTSGNDKDKIVTTVEEIKAGGLTAGGAGIKLGFKTNKAAYLRDGVNEVIIITDGAFNKDSKNYKRFVKKYGRLGISMSVVGIKMKSIDKEEMHQAATTGKGAYIEIDRLKDAKNNLRQHIRLTSYKY